MWVSDANAGLLTDLYELTMAASYFAHGMDDSATFDLFVRHLPEHRNYLIACGLDDALEYLEKLHFDDDAIVEICEHDGRIVLTRDRELLKRRAVTHGCYVHALESEAQLREVVERLDLARSAKPFTLCLYCNAPLRPVDKASVLDRLPPRVREFYEHFSTCYACGRVYWEGSHWRNMGRLLDGLLPNGETGGT